MTKKELVSEIAKRAGLRKTDAKKALDAMMEAVEAELKEGREVRLVGFGTWKVVERAERKGVNPRTREKITIPARKVVKFVPGKKLTLS